MPKQSIQYVSQDVPAFLRKFKERVGYKEGPNIDTKRQALERDDSDRSDNEDERPTVVVLRKGHLTSEEVEEIRKASSEDLDETKSAEMSNTDGKVEFNKCRKRLNNTNELHVSTKKKKEAAEKPNNKHKIKKLDNKKLLSFNDDDDDEEED